VVPETTQELRLKEFLKNEIEVGFVTVEGNRVITGIGALFAPASDQLMEGRQALFERIGAAAELESGVITVEGHTDSDPISTYRYPNNIALAEARAKGFLRPLLVKIAIGITLLLLWGLWFFLRRRKAKQGEKELEEELIEIDLAGDEAAATQSRMKEMLGQLRKASGKSRNYLYSQPWYVIIGPPGAGKTTALLTVYLWHFPLMSCSAES